MPSETARDTGKDAALLEEIRQRFDYAWNDWQEIVTAGNKDMRAVAGDPWDPKEREAREAAMRPVLALDELGQYFNQVINDVLANPISMKFDPTGQGASEEGAQFYADKAREIEYRSKAQIAYTTAFANTIQRSFGWVRLSTRFGKKSLDQEIWIDEIADPNAVIPDPDFKRPDFSDGKFLFYVESRSVDEFKREYPKAKIQDFAGFSDIAPAWVKENRIQIAEYWKVDQVEKELLRLQLLPVAAQPGQPPPPNPAPVDVYADELQGGIPPGAKVLKRRIDTVPTVTQYLTNGVEILKETKWAGCYIPFASCLGKVLYVDEGAGTKRRILSMTRLARDPYMLYCYYRTQQAEMAGMIPKVPVMGYKGQFRDVEQEWQRAPHEPLAFLEAQPTVAGLPPGTILPLPTRLAYDAGEHLQALELCAEGARRSIQSAMGSSPLPTQAQRHNEKSGVALRQMDSSSQKGSFHFVASYQYLIERIGVMFEDLMDKIYDTARDVGVRKANDTAESVRINDPQAVKDGAPAPLSTKGEYLVTVSTGPSTDSTRQAASDFADQMAQNPQVFPLIASELIRLKQLGPIGDEMADALEALKPPGMQKKNGQPPLPPEAQQAMQENGQLKQQLQQASEMIKTDQAKQQAVIAKANIDQKTAIQLQIMKDATSIAVAKINAQAKGVIVAMEAENEALALAQQQAHDAATQADQMTHEAQQNEQDRQHEAAMSVMQAQHGANAADQAHGNALEQGAAQSDAAMQQQANQAALQPPDTGGA